MTNRKTAIIYKLFGNLKFPNNKKPHHSEYISDFLNSNIVGEHGMYSNCSDKYIFQRLADELYDIYKEELVSCHCNCCCCNCETK